MSVYRRELAKARLGDNIANHMGFIFALALYDKFDLTFKQITNYYTKTVNKRVAWQDDDNEDVTSESMMEYCRKRKIDVVGWVKSIPMSQKLYMADIQKGARSAWSRPQYRKCTGIHNVLDNSHTERIVPVLECQDRGIYEVGCLLH